MKTKYSFLVIALFFCIYLAAQNNSITMDGTNDYIDLSDGIANSDNFTFEAWVYWEGPSNESWQRIFDFGNSSSTGYMFLTPCADDDNIRFGIKPTTNTSESIISGTVSMPVNEWHHLSITISSSNVGILYLDGIIIGTNNSLELLPSALGNTTNNFLGKSQYDVDPYFDGKLDEVRIWSTVRTQSEIRSNMYNELESTETGLVAYYQMNETEGTSNTTLPCSATTPQDAILINMDNSNLNTSPAFYGPGNCLEFDGSEYISIPDNVAFDINTQVTIEAWVNYTEVAGERPIVIKEGGAFYLYASPPAYEGKAGFFIEGVSTNWLTSTSSINDGLWHHITGTYDGSSIKLYVDGVLENSIAKSGNATNSNQDLTIGFRNGSLYFIGKIDEVRIWNIAKTQKQLVENMNKQLTGNETGLIAYYNFNNNFVETLQDFTPNTLDGTLINMETTTDWVDSEAFNSWLNTSTTTWADATNWSRNSVPDADDNVGIYTDSDENQPIADDNLECNNLVIATANTFEIENTSHRTIHGSVWNVFDTKIKDNSRLTITGSLYMLHNSTVEIYPLAQLEIEKDLHTRYLGLDGTMTIKSDETGSGSLIVDGSSTGNVTFERYLPGVSNAWHTYSAPVNSVSISGSDFDPGTGTQNDFYTWYEPEPGIWVNFKNQTGSGGTPSFPTANDGNNFKSGKGYLIAYVEASPTKTIAGDINTDATEIPLKNSGTTKDWTYVTGWNLLGNPFSSAINWYLVDHNENTSLFQDEFAYAYDQSANGGAGDYVNIDGTLTTATIAAQQGFFVLAKLSSNDQKFTFTTNLKKHANNNVYKNKSQIYDIELVLKADTFFDETSIRVTNNSKPERDFYDALKLFSFNEKSPGIYSISNDNINLAINSLPDINTNTIINIGVKIPEKTMYTISTSYIDSETIDEDVFLEDKYENTVTNLKSNSYAFSSLDGDFTDRFALHFKAVGISESENISNNIKIFSYNNTITIINNLNLTGIVKITNILGQEIASTNLTGNNKQEYNLDVEAGVYIINAEIDNGYVYSEKLIIN